MEGIQVKKNLLQKVSIAGKEREGEQEEIIKREYKWISKTVLRVGKEKMEASKVNWVNHWEWRAVNELKCV